MNVNRRSLVGVAAAGALGLTGVWGAVAATAGPAVVSGGAPAYTSAAAGTALGDQDQLRDRLKDGSCTTSPTCVPTGDGPTQDRDRIHQLTVVPAKDQIRDRKKDGSCTTSSTCDRTGTNPKRDRIHKPSVARSGAKAGSQDRQRDRDKDCTSTPIGGASQQRKGRAV